MEKQLARRLVVDQLWATFGTRPKENPTQEESKRKTPVSQDAARLFTSGEIGMR